MGFLFLHFLSFANKTVNTVRKEGQKVDLKYEIRKCKSSENENIQIHLTAGGS